MSIYKPIRARVEKIVDETPNIKTFTLVPEKEIPFKTGQFIELTVPKVGEAPFTPSSSPYQKEKFDVTIMKIDYKTKEGFEYKGYVTSAIHELKEGDVVGVRGPYGRGYPVDKMYGKEILIVGGGVGMAPLRSFLLTVLHDIDKFKRVILCYGARTPKDIVYKKQFEEEWMKNERLEVYRSVDKADETWHEVEGVVTVLLDQFKPGEKKAVNPDECISVVCGPPIMMKFTVKKLVEELKLKPENIYLSMEKNMSCGLGKCGHCQIGRYYACKDGPVFAYSEIMDIPGIWE